MNKLLYDGFWVKLLYAGLSKIVIGIPLLQAEMLLGWQNIDF